MVDELPGGVKYISSRKGLCVGDVVQTFKTVKQKALFQLKDFSPVVHRPSGS